MAITNIGMGSGQFLNYPTPFLNLAGAWLDDLVLANKKPCQLFYADANIPCPNCIINPRTHESTNRYKPGGPIPFQNGQICPVCEGKGVIRSNEGSEIIFMSLTVNPRIWAQGPWGNIEAAGQGGEPIVQLPSDMIQSRGFIADITKVMKCQYAILDTTQSPYLNNHYQLAGDVWVPGRIVKNQQFLAIWKKMR